MRKVKYKTKCFGNLPDGTIIDAYIIAEGDGRAILYHPDNGEDYLCATIELCVKKRNHYESFHPDSYINLTDDADYRFRKKLAPKLIKSRKRK